MKTNIAFISEHASPLATLGGVDAGGQNVYVAELAKYLSQEVCRVDVFTRLEDPNQEEIVEWMPGVRVIHIKAGPVTIIPKEELLQHMPEFRDQMLEFIRRESISYKLIHAHFFMSAWVACEIKKLLAIPFVVTFHALGIIRRIHQKGTDGFPEERIAIERTAVEMADHIIAECTQDWEDLTVHYNANPQKISIIPCGFCPDGFHKINRVVARQITGLDMEDKIILQLGRMVPRKGVDNVIESLSLLKNKYKNVKLVIVGGESDEPDPVICPEIGRLQKLAAERNVSDQIIFTGRKDRDQLKYYYAAADVFVTTPWYEPFGITPLESMACGTPVIGSNVGGIKYSISEGRTGFLVPPKDPEALAKKIELLLGDEILLQYMRHNSLLRVNNLFTWANVAAKTIHMYRKIIHPGSVANIIPLWQEKSDVVAIDDKEISLVPSTQVYAKSNIH